MGAQASRPSELGAFDEVFDLGRVVGRGAFGKVYAIQQKSNPTHMYAMKVLDKARLIRKKMVRRTMVERDLLEHLEYPLIVNLRGCWQTEENLCQMFELMVGGDLRYLLSRGRKLDLETARHYTAQVLLALRYLASERVIHRDIKPDNLLLDKDGQCHLADFNISVRIGHKDDPVCTGRAGSKGYISPEMIFKKQYSYKTDIFSIGVVCFEMLFAHRPFADGTREELAYELSQPIKYPKNADPKAVAFLEMCLCSEESRYTAEQALQDPFFSEIDLDGLVAKTVKSPFIPSTTANVSGRHDLEEQFHRHSKSPSVPVDQGLFTGWEYMYSAVAAAVPEIIELTDRLQEEKTGSRDGRSKSVSGADSESGIDPALRRLSQSNNSAGKIKKSPNSKSPKSPKSPKHKKLKKKEKHPKLRKSQSSGATTLSSEKTGAADDGDASTDLRAKSAEDIRSSFEFVKSRKKSRARSPSASEREDEEKHGKKKEHRHRRATDGGGGKHKKRSGSETCRNTLDPNEEGEPISLNRSSSSGNIPGKRRHRRHPVGKTNRQHRSASTVADNVIDDSDDDAGLLPVSVSVDSSRSSDCVDIIIEFPR